MTRLAWLALAAALATTGCGRLGTSAPTAPRAPIPAASIQTVNLTPTSTGYVLKVLAVTPTQGYWNARLIPTESEAEGSLAFTFAASPPPGTAPVPPERAREIAVATYLSRRDLAGIGEIVVRDAGSARALRF